MIDLSYTYTVVTWCKGTKKKSFVQVFVQKNKGLPLG